MNHVYQMQYHDGRIVRIKAAKFQHDGDYILFYRTEEAYSSQYHARYAAEDVENVVCEDMLLSSFEDSALLPEILAGTSDNSDFVRDAMFTEADKVPFTPTERASITKALQDAEDRIAETFEPAAERLDEIHQKLEYLRKKVAELDKFNWKRLFITTLVGVAVDLGFGTLIPNALLEIFKEIFSHVSERLLSLGRRLKPK